MEILLVIGISIHSLYVYIVIYYVYCFKGHTLQNALATADIILFTYHIVAFLGVFFVKWKYWY